MQPDFRAPDGHPAPRREGAAMEQLPTTNREIRLASRPTGWPTLDNFSLATAPLRTPGDGEVLVRNLYMGVDPYMRGRMDDRKSYVPSFKVGEPLSGGVVGEVIASNAAALPVGTRVSHDYGWREYAVGPAKAFQPL